MSTFYIQLEDRLLKISGDLTHNNIIKALGYTPSDFSGNFNDLIDNPLAQDDDGKLKIVDESGNIISIVDSEGIHSIDFVAGDHKLSDKVDKKWVTEFVTETVTEGKVNLDGYATESWVENKGYAKQEDLDNIDFNTLKNTPFLDDENGELNIVDENNNIGLRLNSDGLYVKDVIADGHTLSQKADKSELSNYATKDEVSDLVDMSVVTELQGKVNTLIDTDADKSVRDIAVDVLTETLVSETATEAYDTLSEMSAWIKSHPEDASAMNTVIQKNATDIQSNTTAISNLDAAYKAADAKVLTDAQQYTDNINFYTIKDNPIVDGEAGSITFVDETGYIGLKVTEDGIIAKDVVTPEHTLSSKADKSFVEDNYYNKSTVDKKIAEAVTGGQVSLDGFATEQWVNEQGFLKDHQDISHLATKAELPTVPTKVSELENDSKFITIDEVPEVTVPTKTSDLTNDSGFITIEDVPVLEIPEDYVTETELNDKGFLTEHQNISHLASKNWVESQGYAHQEDLLEISFNDIQDSPISIDDSGMINFVDESGNVGFQINEEGLRVTDVIAGEHKLSQKANASDIPSLDGYAKTEELPDFNEFAKTSDIPSLEGYAKLEDIPEIPEIPSLDDYATKEWVNNKNYATEYDLNNIEYSSIKNTPTAEDETGELNITDENGNIGMKVSSEAVYAKDFIADGHKLSEKINKDYVDNSIAELVDGAPETLNTLNEIAAALKDNADIVDVLNQSISSKQDIISDIETIRQGAAKGATALQSYTEKYKGTVTGVKVNGTTKNPSNGVVDLGTVITSHQDISGKQDKLVSGTNIKTINGTSILGSGNIIISGSGEGSSSNGNAYQLVNHGTSDITFALTPNTLHVWDNVDSLTLTLGDEIAGVANEYLFQFTSDATATTLTLPDTIKWANDEMPIIESNYVYQVSILKGFATFMKFKNNNSNKIVFPLFLYDYNTPNEESIWLYNTIVDYCIINDTTLFEPDNLDGSVYINDKFINSFEYLDDYIEVTSPDSFNLGAIYSSGKVQF